MLENHAADVAEERSTSRSPLTDDDARALLGAVAKVIVAKGRKTRELASADATLDDLKGPTGNFRAPILRRGDVLLVGFHADTLEALVAD